MAGGSPSAAPKRPLSPGEKVCLLPPAGETHRSRRGAVMSARLALYRFDGWIRMRSCRPWHGNGTWQHGSRVGTSEALWVYWLPDGHEPAEASESAQGAA